MFYFTGVNMPNQKENQKPWHILEQLSKTLLATAAHSTEIPHLDPGREFKFKAKKKTGQ